MKRLLSILIIILGFTVSAQEQDPCYSVNDFMIQTEGENSSITKNFVGGWNMFGYPCSQEIDVVEAFSSIIDKVLIVKSNNGSVYMPEFGFNGIGFLEGGEGYQIKMSDTEYGFSFCEPITWPNLEGCTDCEAVNFNQWANVDDGTCNYDSDDDGIPDSEEIVGCQDSLACNYNILATDSGQCNYAEEFFNCDGTPQIGASYEGGIVFYLDETGQRGLVAAIEDLTEGSSDPHYWGFNGYEWGCFQEEVNGADLTSICSGYQNTINIVSQGCEPIWSSVTAAQAALYAEINGYSDWYLPSIDELTEMFYTIGNGSNEDNSGGFVTLNIPFYISSSESDNANALGVYFNGGGIADWQKDYTARVRVIRAFGYTLGCMDPLSCNFNPEANMADGSCTYPEQGYDCNGNTIVQVGDEAFGGIVFYIDESGQRGLVAAIEDLDNLYTWGCQGVNILTDLSLGYGLDNTLKIIDNCSESPIAATEVLDIEIGGFADWFLPSQHELILMWASIGQGSSLDNFGGFSANFYYSSSQKTNMAAYGKYFPNGDEYEVFKNSTAKIRPIRAFGNWIEGCIDETACNYNSEVNLPNSTLCEYPPQGYDCDGNITEYIVGMEAEGGIVFYVDETGEHGLVAAMEDVTEGATNPLDWSMSGYEWGCYQVNFSTAIGVNIGTGYQNTIDILEQNCTSNGGGIIAAAAANNYESLGYTDWYLPSIDELIEISNTIGYNTDSNIGQFQPYSYWSSSIGENFAWAFNFGVSNGNGEGYYQRYYTALVRPIRSF